MAEFLPDNVTVLFSSSPVGNPCQLWFGASWPIVMRDYYSDAILKDALKNSYKVAIQLGHLCFAVCHWTLKGFSIGLIDNFHQLVCPESGSFRHLGSGTLPESVDESTILRELIESTAVFEDTLSAEEIICESIRTIKATPES
jgi:hypothetical protein